MLNSSKRFIAIAGAATAVLMSLAISSTAHASDGKTWPATICKYWNADENPSASNLDFSQFGRLINRANQRLAVVCPLERDSQTHNIEEVRVFARSTNCIAANVNQPCAGLTTRCTMRVMNMTGDVTRSSSQRTLVRYDNGNGTTAWLTTRWTNISVPDFPSGAQLHTGSTFVMFCEIGVNEELTGFYMQEAGG